MLMKASPIFSVKVKIISTLLSLQYFNRQIQIRCYNEKKFLQLPKKKVVKGCLMATLLSCKPPKRPFTPSFGTITLEGQRAVEFLVLIENFFSLKNFKVVSLVFCSVLCGDVSQGFTQ